MATIVVKFGTQELFNNGSPNQHVFNAAAQQIKALTEAYMRCIVVSSGAVRAGKLKAASRFGDPPIRVRNRVLASIGSPILMKLWESAFGYQDILVAQVWLTQANLRHRHERRDLLITINNALDHGIVPIINENDAVSPIELWSWIRQGGSENDSLAAITAVQVKASHLLIITSAGGVYDGHPDQEGTRLIPLLRTRQIAPLIKKLGHAPKSADGRGGIQDKLKAARYFVQHTTGGTAAIARMEEDTLLRFMAGDSIGTMIVP